MKSTLVSLLIATLAGPALGLTPAADPAAPLGDSPHRCNWKHIDEAIKASDMAKIKKELGDAAIEGSAGEERIKVPTSGENLGDASGNPLCHHEVWNIINRYKSQDGKPFHSSKKGLAAVKEQISVLKSIGDAFVPLDDAIEKVVQEAKQALSTGDSLKIVKVDKTKPKTKLETRGPAVLALKTEERAEYTSEAVADFTKEKGKPGDEGKRLVLALVAEKQPEDVAQVHVGVRVEEFQKALGELKKATKVFVDAVSSDLASKTGDLSKEVKFTAGSLPLSEVRKELDLLAKSKAKWDGTAPTSGTGAFGDIDWAARDRLSVYGNSVIALIEATAKAYTGRSVSVPGEPGAAPVEQPKPAVDGAATSGKIEKFRGAFESKALEDINAGIGAMDLSEPEKAALREKYKGAKAQVVGNTVILVDASGNPIKYDEKGLKVTAVAELPKDVEKMKDEEVAADAAAKAKPIADAILAGDLAAAKAKAAATAATDPAMPEGHKLWESLAAGGAAGLKSESSCTGPDKTTAEDYKNKLGRDAREKSAKRSAKRVEVEKEYEKALAEADAAFEKCAVFPKGDPRGAEGSSIMAAKLMSEGDKMSHPTVVKCGREKRAAIAEAEKKYAESMAAVGTEEMQAGDDAASDKKAEAGAALKLKAHVINRVTALRGEWVKSPDGAKPYAKGYENEITATRIRSYFAATWPKGGPDEVSIEDPMKPTAAEVKSLERPAKYDESFNTCIGSGYGVRIGANDDVEKCVGGLFGRYIDGLAAAAAGGAPAADPGAGGGEDFKAKVKECMNRAPAGSHEWRDGACVKK